jgi:hypothetical protein
MGSSELVHPANGTETDDQAISAEDRALLDNLVVMWRPHTERDFETRHQTGRLLNERLGPPDKRQSQGQRVLKAAAKELGTSESDLNRMRWLAHLFADLAALRQSHPGIVSWTRFKEALPSLVPPKGGEARKPAANPAHPAIGGFVRSIKNATAKLNRLDIQPGDAEREKVLDGLRELVEAVSRRLMIRVEVAVE